MKKLLFLLLTLAIVLCLASCELIHICDICGCFMEISTPTNHFLRNQAGCEWLNEITADDIKEIKMISGGGGPLPPISLTYISSSTDKAVISNIFEQYYWLDTAPMNEPPVVCDGGYFTVQFVLNNGAVKQLSFLIGKYISDAEGNYYKIHNLPMFCDGANFVNYYGFEIWDRECSVYFSDGLLVAVIPTDELEFIELMDDIELGANSPTHYIEMNGERINFVSEYYFYINDNRDTYYQLVGKTLNELIAENAILYD